VVDIADTNVLRRTLPRLQIVVLVVALVGVLLALAIGSMPGPRELIGLLAVVAVLVLAPLAVQRSIQRAAAQDSIALVAIVGEIIGASEGARASSRDDG
jgi:hypothetical protein